MSSNTTTDIIVIIQARESIIYIGQDKFTIMSYIFDICIVLSLLFELFTRSNFRVYLIFLFKYTNGETFS